MTDPTTTEAAALPDIEAIMALACEFASAHYLLERFGGQGHGDVRDATREALRSALARSLPVADEARWTLSAPDGRRWHGDSGLQCAAAERRERVPDKVALERIYAAAAEARNEEEVAADRYDWLRAHSFVQGPYGVPATIHFGAGVNQTKPELLDAAIDSAMAPKGAKT